jgi:hypothetical protein
MVTSKKRTRTEVPGSRQKAVNSEGRKIFKSPFEKGGAGDLELVEIHPSPPLQKEGDSR